MHILLPLQVYDRREDRVWFVNQDASCRVVGPEMTKRLLTKIPAAWRERLVRADLWCGEGDVEPEGAGYRLTAVWRLREGAA